MDIRHPTIGTAKEIAKNLGHSEIVRIFNGLASLSSQFELFMANQERSSSSSSSTNSTAKETATKSSAKEKNHQTNEKKEKCDNHVDAIVDHEKCSRCKTSSKW